MRKIIASFVLLAATLTGVAVAQTLPQLAWASAFNQWSAIGQAPNTYTFTSPLMCQFPNPYSASTFGFKTNAPLYIRDQVSANSEVVTLSSVSSCGFVPASTSHNHYTFEVLSGTAGLQEAINASSGTSSHKATVLLDAAWWANAAVLGTPATILADAAGSTSVAIADTTAAPWTWYAWNGSNYVVSANVPANLAWLDTVAIGVGASPSTSRAITGSFTTGSTTISGAGTNSFAGVRGLVTETAAQTLSSGFWFGTQGKVVIDSATVDIGSNHMAGLYGQMSASGATVTSGHVAIIIASGQNLPSSTKIDGIYLESGTGPVNSAMKTIFNASYVFDLDYQSSDGAGAMALTGGTCNTPAGYLKLKVHGADRYLLLCTTVS